MGWGAVGLRAYFPKPGMKDLWIRIKFVLLSGESGKHGLFYFKVTC